MRRWLAATALCATIVAAPAYAADWYLATSSVRGSSVIFVDRDSIRPPSGQLRQAQVYYVVGEDMADGTASLDALIEVDCAAPRRRVMVITGFDARLQRVRQEQGSGEWRDIVAGSQDAAVRNFVCSNGATRRVRTSYGSAYPFAAGRAVLREEAGR